MAEHIPEKPSTPEQLEAELKQAYYLGTIEPVTPTFLSDGLLEIVNNTGGDVKHKVALADEYGRGQLESVSKIDSVEDLL